MVKVEELKSYWGKDALKVRPVEHTGTEPILISSDGYIVNGHKRTIAAKIRGDKEIDAIVLKTTFVDSEPIRMLDSKIKKAGNWELLRLLRKALAIR